MQNEDAIPDNTRKRVTINDERTAFGLIISFDWVIEKRRQPDWM